jgi:hypothetical protein
MTIISDSKTTLEGIIKHHTKWEDNDWLNIENRKEWEELLYRLRIRRAETHFKWVKGHNGDEGNEMADKMASEGAQKETENEIKYFKKERFTIRGARLQSLKQSTAYQLILRQRKGIKNDKKKHNLEDSKDEIERVTGYRPNDKQIWKGMYLNHLKNKIGDMLWTMMQGRMRCGYYFTHIKDMEENQYCSCGEIETIDHILLGCKENKIEHIWELARETKNKEWIEPTPGILRGIGAFQAPCTENENEDREQDKSDKKADRKSGTKRYQILVSEAMWLIWTKRNKRIFEKEKPNEKRLTDEWIDIMRRRIEIDYTKIKQLKYEKRKKATEEFRTLWCNHTETVRVKERKGGKQVIEINF